MAQDLDAREFPSRPTTAERLTELNLLAARISSASGLVGRSVPHLVVQKLGAQTGNPAVITFASRPGARAGLQRMSDGDLVSRATELVEAIAPVLGIPARQAAEFAASPSITDAGTVRVVRIAQRYRGIPIFHATNALHFGPDDQPRTLLGETITVTADRPAEPVLTAAEGLLAAAAFVTAPPPEPETDQFGNPVRSPPAEGTDFRPRLLAQGHTADQSAVFDGGPFATPIRASLMWFPRTIDDLRLAWAVEIAFPAGTARYRTLVDAVTGEVLHARQLVQGVRARASVFALNGGAPRETVALPLNLDTYGVPVPDEPFEGIPRDWVDLDRTVGNSTVAVFGSGSQSLQAQVVDGEVAFVPASESGDDQRVLNAFYFACRAHDLFYLLGFREKDWNFQADNGRHGGIGGDPVRVEVHPGPVNLTASMNTLVEGASPTLKLGLHQPTGRHCALDATVVTHEFAHGVTNRLVGGPSDIHALDDGQSRGMGEGWGDYFACTMFGTTAIGSWLVDRPAGIRGFVYDENFPAQTEHFGRLGRGRYRNEHAVGEIWAATLLDMNRRIGNALGMQLVMLALKLSPSNPSFLAMRDAILAAAGVLVETGDLQEEALPSTRDAIWAAFAKFGMGPNASCDDASFRNIVTDFSTPALGATTDPFGRQRSARTITLESDAGQSVSITPSTPDAESTLTVTDPRPVTAISVTVDLDHPSPEQVRITLRSPGGRAILHNGAASSQLPGSYTSDETPALAALLGRPAAGAWSLLVVDLVGSSTGALRSWRLGLSLGTGSEVAEASPHVAIPDNSAAGVESTVQFGLDGEAARITVQLDLTHPQPADLLLELVAPSGKRALLRGLDDPAGGSIQSYDSDSNQRLATLLEEGIAGVWTLHVADCVAGDAGTLDRWKLTVRPDRTDP